MRAALGINIPDGARATAAAFRRPGFCQNSAKIAGGRRRA
jgi:hypothetical protein